MARIVVELTDRCQLSCEHCPAGRHGGRDDLPLEILEKILIDAKVLGFDLLAFTGGEPTVHPHFAEVIRRTCEANYKFGIVTNGWNFVSVYPLVARYAEQLAGITFSVDGAAEATHDRQRGRGSFRRVLQAMSVCVVKQLPFTINMVVTAQNRHELAKMAELAVQLGSSGLRFGHLMPSGTMLPNMLQLSPAERRQVEAEIRALGVPTFQQEQTATAKPVARDGSTMTTEPIAKGRARTARIPILMAPGYWTEDLFPCSPLKLQEINLDCRGNLTKCCHLSGYESGGSQDVFGNLAHVSLAAAYHRLADDNQSFRREKAARHACGSFRATDYFPCDFCARHYGKVE